jgi:hypothetical protein
MEFRLDSFAKVPKELKDRVSRRMYHSVFDISAFDNEMELMTNVKKQYEEHGYKLVETDEGKVFRYENDVECRYIEINSLDELLVLMRANVSEENKPLCAITIYENRDERGIEWAFGMDF